MNIKLKDEITRYDLINVINTIVDLVIYKDDDGAVQYKPYDKDFAFEIGVTNFIMDGVDLSNVADFDEFINSNQEILDCLKEFKNNHAKNYSYIKSMSEDMIEFKKKELLNKNDEINAKLIKALETEEKLNELSLELARKQAKILEQQIKSNEYEEEIAERMTPEEVAKLNQMFLSGEFDANQMVDKVLEKYLDSAEHKDKINELLDEKNNQIVELSEFKKKHEARNVLADGR